MPKGYAKGHEKVSENEVGGDNIYVLDMPMNAAEATVYVVPLGTPYDGIDVVVRSGVTPYIKRDHAVKAVAAEVIRRLPEQFMYFKKNIEQGARGLIRNATVEKPAVLSLDLATYLEQPTTATEPTESEVEDALAAE